jgi:DNA polymerase I-like protein with 3'-5' exonuclease and polymerase domains
MLYFDIEANGFLNEATKMHCLHNYVDGALHRYNSDIGNLNDGLKQLEKAETICAHNGLGYDGPLVNKLFPNITLPKIFDTLVASRLIFTNLTDIDYHLIRTGKLVHDEFKSMIGRHSLKAWGYRLGVLKGTFGEEADWSEWTQEMDDYCATDVKVLYKLKKFIDSKNYSEEALHIEHEVRRIINRQENFGFKLDVDGAISLALELETGKNELTEKLQAVIKPWYMGGDEFTPKRDNKSTGYVAGAPHTKVKLNTFNPGSRKQIIDRLQTLYGWIPTKFTEKGNPSVDDEVLQAMPYDISEDLREYLTITKCLGTVATGDKAWLKKEQKSRIHGRVNTNGAVTGRMTHSNPNLGQVPSSKNKYGKACRKLFIVDVGYILLGADAKGIELRMLAGYMAQYDNGAYAEAVVNGNKSDGTDAHTLNMKAAGLFTRDGAKTFVYALLYGSGNANLGVIYLEDMPEEMRQDFNEKYPTGEPREEALKQLGGTAKNKLMTGLPALKQLKDAVEKAAARGFLIGLDGRRIHIRETYRALNSLLQGASAVIMKKALMILDDKLIAAGLKNSDMTDKVDYEFVANVHDEFQIQVLEEHAELVKVKSDECFIEAGEHFKFKVKIEGDAEVGNNWSETH